jgi:regulator of replication initiation timing
MQALSHESPTVAQARASWLVYLTPGSETHGKVLMSDAGSSQVPPESDSTDSGRLEATLVEPLTVPFYLLVEPLVSGKQVLDVAAAVGGPGPECLRRAGAAEVISCVLTGPSLPLPDAGVDIVLRGLPVIRSDADRGVWMAEIRRVLRPGGFCVLRLAAAALRDHAQAGAGLRTACMDLLLAYFATVDIVEETQFGGVAFHVPGTEDLAVNESLTRLTGASGHLVALCADCAERPWNLPESLLVPTEAGAAAQAGTAGVSAGELAAWQGEVARLEARCAELSGEREDAREGAMTLRDRADRLERTVAVLRRDVERFLRQISDDAAARELLALERDNLRRDLSAATQQAADAAREVERRQVALRTLEKEVVRLRAARGGAGRPDGKT